MSSLEVGLAAGELGNQVELSSMCHIKREKKSHQHLMVSRPSHATFADLIFMRSFQAVQNVTYETVNFFLVLASFTL